MRRKSVPSRQACSELHWGSGLTLTCGCQTKHMHMLIGIIIFMTSQGRCVKTMSVQVCCKFIGVVKAGQKVYDPQKADYSNLVNML